jgi:DNA polymerase elongation subunit (family B)
VNILLLDIETAPNTVHTWGLWKQNIAINQIIASGYVLCWSAKWLGQDKIYFSSVHRSSSVSMLDKIHRMLNKADAVVHYNGQKFDIPTLNKEFVKYKFKPPSNYAQVDLMRTCKKIFRFESNKLDYVCQFLGLGEKIRHAGQELWTNCMAGKEDAWKKMREYNEHDIVLLENLYHKLLPWITNHPNHGAYEDFQCCPNCGGIRYIRQGFKVTKVMKYPRLQCQDCGTWFRSNKAATQRGEERFVPA